MILPIIGLTLLGSIFSLLGGFVLLLKKDWNRDFSLILTSFAAGVLLSTSFLDLFPEALHHMEEKTGGDVFLPALLGIVIFFLLERTLVWFHHHHDAHDTKPTIWMITFGDSIHNFIDGVAIAAAFMVNPTVGFTTALAVAAHEIPQEIADFSILLSQGLSRKKTLLFNIVSAGTALLGAGTMYFFSPQLEKSLGTIIAFAAGMFCYIALSDLIPELHHSQNKKQGVPQIMAFVTGILLIAVVKLFIGEH